MKKIIFAFLLLCFSTTAYGLEFQWKFVIPAIDTREAAVEVYGVLESINGVYDININIERNSVMFFYDDDKTNEELVAGKLTGAGYVIEKKMLLEEPKGGVMN